jgi:hypothetical protein
MSPCCLDESRSSTTSRCTELAGAPLGKDLFGGLGKHLREAREHPWAYLLRGLGHRTLSAAEYGLGTMGDEGAAGDGGGGTRGVAWQGW